MIAAQVRGLNLVLIPKNGQTAMRAALLASLGLPPQPRWDHEELNTVPVGALGTAGFTACCIRHPLDRLVSCWADKISGTPVGGSKALLALGYRMGMTFREFVGHAAEMHAADVHTRRQTEMVPHRIDFMWRFERMEGGWNVLRKRFAWLAALDPINASVRGSWRDYYDDASRRVSEAVYAADFDLWRRACAP